MLFFMEPPIPINNLFMCRRRMTNENSPAISLRYQTSEPVPITHYAIFYEFSDCPKSRRSDFQQLTLMHPDHKLGQKLCISAFLVKTMRSCEMNWREIRIFVPKNEFINSEVGWYIQCTNSIKNNRNFSIYWCITQSCSVKVSFITE